MIASIEDFIRYFEGVHRRTLRDIEAIPERHLAFSPPSGEGEVSWPIAKLIGHLTATRGYFVSAFLGEGWLAEPEPPIASIRAASAALERSVETLRDRLSGHPDTVLQQRVRLIEDNGDIAAWRILMMLVEHEVHHRSQVNAYAPFANWSPPQLYERRWEQILDLQPKKAAS
jgi:uncharacterized damage-inducible protein DinB